MVNLSTKYMGLQLDNPLVIASCSIVKHQDAIRRCADAGAGAIVLKSLFEEQIEVDAQQLEQHLWMASHSEAFDYVTNMGMELGPREYLKLIEDAKKAVSLPIIASLNCISSKWWLGYAKQIAAAGADALELNISIMPGDSKRHGGDLENIYLQIVDDVKREIDLPVAVKIGPHFSSLSRMASQLASHGASALVLFNRFYQLDIDIDRLELVPGNRFSSPEEMSLSLRWVSVLYGRTDCDLAASTGIHDGHCVIKQLLAGATVTQLCSTLYIYGVEQITHIRSQLEQWMIRHNFATIDDFRGRLSQQRSNRPEIYERLQYIKALVASNSKSVPKLPGNKFR